MKKLALRAIDTAKQQGASYADIRIIYTQHESVETENGRVVEVTRDESWGFGVRVVAQGAWGFVSANELKPDALDRAAAKAVRIAKASHTVMREPVRLAPEPVVNTRWQTPCEIDPFRVPVEAKVKLLLDVDKILRQKPEIVRATGNLAFTKERQWMATTDGSFIDQELLRSGGGFTATASGNNDTQDRSYPAGHGGNFRSAGYEFINSLDFVSHAAQTRDEAVALLTAEACPTGVKDVILEGHQLALQIHESVGHPLELDRVLGMEASFAGRSFMTTDKLKGFEYGSPIVNLVADTTLPGGLGTCGFDDDGVAAQRWHVVQDGQFKAYFTNREFAHEVGESRSRGCNRTWGFSHIPIVRIPNLGLLPGEWKYEDLIRDTEDGILMATNKSWSIDQMRLNFQFGTEIAWEIKNGKLGKLYKNPNYQGITPEFWRSCDAICDNDSWMLWGVHNCGKGEPMQVAEMSHANSPARFRKVKVGIR
ncbi:MAG: TldD/PmbA family protein [Deltaproteobacteria bacterium]|nr:TldD/PmbA family protein [Deltaproteobacteria bacterium]